MGLGIGDQTTISQGTAIKYDITPVASLAKGMSIPPLTLVTFDQNTPLIRSLSDKKWLFIKAVVFLTYIMYVCS